MTTAVNPGDVAPGEHLFGNLGRAPQFGLTRWLGPFGTWIVYGGMAVVALVSMKSLLAASAITVALVLLLGLMSIRNPRTKQNLLTIVNVRIAVMRTRRRRAHVYRAGPFGQIPHGKYQLPGIGAPTKVTGWTDPHQREFAVVHLPPVNDHTVVMTADPDGGALVDPEQTDQRVARYGWWLAQLGKIPGLRQAVVTMEVTRESVHRLSREFEVTEAADAHPLPKAVAEEILQTYPSQSQSTRGYISLTFSGAGPSGRRSPDEVGHDLQVRMPGLVGALKGTGAGAVRPASVADLCEIVHAAYVPAAAERIAHARAHGHRLPLDWENIGPATMQESLEDLWHEGYRSKTWVLVDPPDGYFKENILAELLTPHASIDRFRLTTIYHPLGPIRTTQAVNAGVNASGRRVAKPNADAADEKMHAVAKQTASEVANGASLLNFSVLLTATVGPGVDYEGKPVSTADRLRIASADVEALCAAAGLNVRPLAAQAAGFALGLGVLGAIPSNYLRIPAEMASGLS
jgi:hypothetical protein